MKRSAPETKTFEDAPLCPKCGQVEPTARFAARVNTKQAYWHNAHHHDIARLTREEVPAKDIDAALRKKNFKEIACEVFPSTSTSPLPPPSVASDDLFALRYTLDLATLYHRHIDDLIEILEAEIAGAEDQDKRRAELERKLQQIYKARSEQRRAVRAVVTKK